MEVQSPGEKQADTNKIVATTSAAVAMATVSSSSTTCTQSPSTSLSIIPSDRQAVQVMQHAIHRPQSMAAQYLHQMYAAQQQHLMLQTAALQQHQHPSHLQSLATIQQSSVCQRQLPSSSSGSLVQPAGVSQNSITLPASPVTAQLIGQTQASTAAATTISQQAILLGSRPANCSQAQMYLRTQMLILTPAATVAALQSDLPAVTSCSSLPISSKVQNLALRAHLPGALTTTHSVILKPSTQSQALSPAASMSKTALCALKANQLSDASTETQPPDVTQMASGAQIITPTYSPMHTHTVVKQQLSCPTGQRVAHHQLILQQATGGFSSHRQLQPIALRVAPQDTTSNPLPLSVKRLTTPSSQAQSCNDPSAMSPSVPSSTSQFASTARTSIPAATVQPQPPPLVAAPQHRTSFPHVQNEPPPPPPPLVLPRLSQNPTASLHRLSLHSVQALAVQSGQMLLTEQELPVAEALVQMPYQNLPPPQTVAVDLKVHPARHNETPKVGQTCKVNGLCSEERKDSLSPHSDRTPPPQTVSPKKNGAGQEKPNSPDLFEQPETSVDLSKSWQPSPDSSLTQISSVQGQTSSAVPDRGRYRKKSQKSSRAPITPVVSGRACDRQRIPVMTRARTPQDNRGQTTPVVPGRANTQAWSPQAVSSQLAQVTRQVITHSSSGDRTRRGASQQETPRPQTGSPARASQVMCSSSIATCHSVIRSPQVEEPSQLTTSSSNPSLPSPPLPPSILPAAERGPSQPPSAPASLPGSPDRTLTSHVLTHLVEGFVIRESLEPFPVGPSSLLADQQASLSESQEIQINRDAAEDSPLDAHQSDSDSEMENDSPAADELQESLAGVLQCQYCGSRGYAHTFVRSKRFCSMTCVRRFSVSCTKQITVLRAGRWGHRPMGRRGRPPCRVNGASREYFLRQVCGLFGSEETQQSLQREEEEQQPQEEEEQTPVPMTTRLRKQAERQREREREQTMTETITVSDEEDVSSPSQWNMEQVFSYVSTLPGGLDVAEEFRSQEIDGQALMLLTEDHLVSTMNLKLGPALKLCAHINSLKDA
ncbi:polyhomeotic-like protein 3 isoform X3 [Acanthochromis polyacanthus]|uniref:polyhomeotic-like protein 3 isoform X3 n=1 Tax=Acanthochromis polyacanthus TaxID=80966 RepID=UPI0022347FB3|nr:polyhomeotic-like protein 3 isoform X3 [Acanthochromis polyacanthus]